MKKITILLVLIISSNLWSQSRILVNMQPVKSNRIVLYTAEGAQQKYVSYADATDGNFELKIPENSPTAVYRLVYDQKTMDYIDFLYFGSPFKMTFNPESKKTKPNFENSPENDWYFEQLFKLNDLQFKMDTLQISMFKRDKDIDIISLESNYYLLDQQVNEWNKFIQNSSQQQFIKDLLLANERTLPQKLITDAQEYLNYIKQHFFDRIDFKNVNLIRSPLLVDKVMDYVFYLTSAEVQSTQNELYKKAVDDVLSKINDVNLQKGFIQSLVQSFGQSENVYLIDYLLNSYYEKLPLELQNSEWKNNVIKDNATAITRKAPDFKFLLNNKETSLYQLKGYEKYIIVFWSTSCSHCMKELPMFYDFIKDYKDVQVIAIGMEEVADSAKWKAETYYYPEFIHVLGQGKWENPIAKSYNIHATPAYFVLNKDKVITEKPYDFEAVEQLFNDN